MLPGPLIFHLPGPLVRIAPNEVLITDPDNYDRIYQMTTRYTKDPGFYAHIGSDSALFCILGNEQHRKERAIFNPFFSRRSVLEQEHVARAKAVKLCARIDRDAASGKGTDIAMGFRAISLDVITEYALGADSCYHALDAEEFGLWYNDLIRQVAPMVYLFKIVPALQPVFLGLPSWLVKRINPIMTGFLEGAEVSCGPSLALHPDVPRAWQGWLHDSEADLTPSVPRIKSRR